MPMTSQGFWKPSTASSVATTSQREGDPSSSGGYEKSDVPFNFSRAPLAQQRMLLPIHKHRRQILYSMEHYGVLIIVGETGSGKSTQIPQFLYENGWCGNDFQVVCTQPRRIAAQTLAKRVAHEVGRGPMGATVGYTVRFDDCTSDDTKIKYVTDGMLLREASFHDPLLSQYSVVMVDEAHERNLNSDALLGMLKKIRRKRKDLRIVVCSATIDAQAFLNFLVKDQSSVMDVMSTNNRTHSYQHAAGGSASLHNGGNGSSGGDGSSTGIRSNLDSGMIISVDGRQHGVEVMYLTHPASDYIRSTVETVFSIHHSKRPGDILCFLPSAEDVDNAIRTAEDFADAQNDERNSKLVFLPLYGSLPYSSQVRVFQPPNRKDQHQRRVIFATNIAETSVTVPRISHVVDSGFAKMPFYDPRTYFERLVVAPISQASAQQRTGRAGRLDTGYCYRLYTEDFFTKQMERASLPEILRSNLASFILSLKALGVENILAFDLMDMPGVDSLSHGMESLFALGALDDKGRLTQMGMDMSAFPTEPRVSRMLLESLREECAYEVAGVASALQSRSLFQRPRGGSARRQQQLLDYETAMDRIVDTSGDHVTYSNLIAENDDTKLDREDCRERFINHMALKRTVEIRDQLVRFLRRFGQVTDMDTATPEERSASIRKCVTAGFFFNVAKLNNDGRYYTLRGGTKGRVLVTPNQGSVFHSRGKASQYIIFSETQDGARGGMELLSVSSIDARWLRELAPHYWQ